MRIARSTGAVSGGLIVLLGTWAALIPFVGPYFDYSFGTNATWHYTSDRLWLNILPGALAVLGGMLLILAGTRPAGIFGGWLALVAGGWLVVGPAVSKTWESGTGPIGRPLFGSTRQMLELVGYFYGVGALIVALSAFAVGRFASRPQLLAEDAAVAGAPGARRADPGRDAGERGVVARDERAAPPAAAAPAGASTTTGPSERPAARAGAEPARRRRLPFLSRRRQAREEEHASERTRTS
jgi:hypothetical protein